MIPRYSDSRVAALFSDKAKVERWQSVELAVIEARAELGLVDYGILDQIESALDQHPCDITWWHAREKETNHDLAAFLDERLRFIPTQLQSHWHEHMTSYDTEDPAFSMALIQAAAYVHEDLGDLIAILQSDALKYRYTVMLARTHGQGAKLRSFGSRILTWLQLLLMERERLARTIEECTVSRISGAIGNYGGGLTPAIERSALALLGLRPFYGATQILPRLAQAPLVQSLRRIAEALNQIAVDFRLGARSGLPLWHEPFGKKQKGSSAMPHKKNTINTEQLGGMLNLVRGAEESILLSIQTWEERAIEQSCVERVAWPDLFHEVLRMISVMCKVFDGMVVYPDNMLREIQASLGTYASDEAKNFLAKECGDRDKPFETAYRIVQLASFCIFKPGNLASIYRGKPCPSLKVADTQVEAILTSPDPSITLGSFISGGGLFPVEEVEASPEEVEQWNLLLAEIFSDAETVQRWTELFRPSYLLKQESALFQEILGAQ